MTQNNNTSPDSRPEVETRMSALGAGHEAELQAFLEEHANDPDALAALGFGIEGVEGAAPGTLVARRQPVLAIVGRPNVGKSTFVNRVIQRREAVVQDVPGITRDRVSYDANWRGRAFTIVDTGGWERDAAGLNRRIAEQVEAALRTADAVCVVVDGKVGPTEGDMAVAKIVQRSGKPFVLAVNKMDDLRSAADVHEMWSLGLGEPYGVSSLHGRGSGDLLDAILDVLPETPEVAYSPIAGPTRVALLGRPNVGKSSLLNQLLGEERVVVDSVAGTTRDPVDSLVDIEGTTYRFVDTAGLRKRFRQADGAEFYSALRTQGALEGADVALLLLDVTEPVSEQDTRVLTQIVESGRAVVVVFNKWDALTEDRRDELDREVETTLARVAWAPRVNISAKTGRSVARLAPAIETALEGWSTRVPTGQLNQWLGRVVGSTPPPNRAGRIPKILFITQASTRPPRFVVFATMFLEPTYRRFLERRLREDFGFAGSPIEISVKVREKRSNKPMTQRTQG